MWISIPARKSSRAIRVFDRAPSTNRVIGGKTDLLGQGTGRRLRYGKKSVARNNTHGEDSLT